MNGFTVICNNCGRHTVLTDENNARHNGRLSIMIHSSTECAFFCWDCEGKLILNDGEENSNK